MIAANDNDDATVAGLNAILLACEQAVERQDIGVAQKLIVQFPQFADDITEFFRCHGVVQRAASPVLAALSDERPLPNLPEYESLEEVGRGGMGIVYKGRHRATGRIDAVKVIHPDRTAAQTFDAVHSFVDRFRRECRLASQVAHENIVPVYHVGESENAAYYSMRYVDGPALNDMMANTPLDPRRAAQYIEQVARAVNALHQHGILHGDIKPHNILIDSESDRPLLSDFGLADVHARENREPTPLFLGTPGYVPREVAVSLSGHAVGQNVAPIGPTIAADVYGLGATLYALLTGSPPHPGATAKARVESTVAQEVLPVRMLNRKIPVALAEICEKAIANDPKDRFHSAAELADSLALWINQPDWSQHFPNLGQLLLAVAPLILLSNLAVFFMMRSTVGLSLIWIPLFAGYIPLFMAFAWSGHRFTPVGRPALRELWSTWIGHCAASVSCYVALGILLAPNQKLALAAFYCFFAAISSVTFFVKSANFWKGYWWIGLGWMFVSISLAVIPNWGPLVFGLCAAATACVIAVQEQPKQIRSDFNHVSSPST